MSVLTEVFPLLRGRTGIQSLKPDIPIVVRVYQNGTKILTHRAKVLSKVSKRGANIGLKPVKMRYRKLYPATMTHVSYSLDYPLLDKLEVVVECYGELGCVGILTLVPQKSGFFTIGEP
jgi:hypothetical protein